MTRLADLTERQQVVAALVADGFTTKQIAAHLHISARRVRIIITATAFLIGADATKDDRVQVALWWWEERTRPRAA